MSSENTLASVPEDSAAASGPASTSTSNGTGLPPAAKAASELAVKTAIAETESEKEDGEISGAATAPGAADDGTIKTVFTDPANFNVVHPLYSKWILWFDNASKQNKAKDWNEQLQEVMTFETVEEFWGLYNKWVSPSFLAPLFPPFCRCLVGIIQEREDLIEHTSLARTSCAAK